MFAKRIPFLLLLCAAVLCVTDCFNERDVSSSDTWSIQSFRDIPDVTADEIEAIEALLKKYDSFSYGMIWSTEAFIKEDGSVGGYAALFCEWLTGLFGIPFEIGLYGSSEMLAKLENGDIDFLGNIIPTEERKEIYFMSDTIAERKFIMVRINNSSDLNHIPLPRYAYTMNTPVGNAISSLLEGSNYELVLANDYWEAYDILKNDKADAYVTTNITESAFIDYDDITIEDFYPLIFSSAVMGASKTRPEMEPIISVVNKALRNGANLHLLDLYKQGYRDYQKHAINASFTDEERAYIAANPVVPVMAFTVNYPLCFFNNRENEWQGIYFDLLDEVTALTGLIFEVGHDREEPFQDVVQSLLGGKFAIVPEWGRNPQTERTFIWSETLIMEDHYVLISKSDYPDITLNEIIHVKVGAARGTDITNTFKRWFPNHTNIIEYADIDAAFSALQNGDVDMVMTTQRRLMYLTHFQEQPGYKVNITFNQIQETRLVAHRDYAVLLGIIDKVLKLTDVEGITYQWMHRTYDYRARIAEAQRPWLISAIVLALIVLFLVIIFSYRNYKVSAKQAVLEESEERINMLLDITPLSINIINRNYQCIYVNDEAVRLYGLKDKQEYFNLFSTGKLSEEKGAKYLQKAFKDGYWRGEMIFLKPPDEEPMPCELTLISMKYKNEDVIAGFARDLREEKAAAEKIRETEEEKHIIEEAHQHLQVILDILPVGIFIISRKNSELLYSNKKAVSIYCARSFEEDGKGRNVLDFAPEFQQDGRKTADVVMELSNLDSYVTEMQHKKLNGDIFWARVAYCSITYNGVAAMLTAIEDMTAEKEHQQMLQTIALREQEANQLKSRFLATMSHEIRTPMNAILGITEIQLRYETLSPEMKEGLEKVYDSGNLLLDIVNDILDLSKIEAGKLEIIPVKYDLPSLINDAVQINRLRYDSKPIDFFIDVDENTPLNLFGDELRIKQILNNILSNAFKYTNKGEIRMSVASEAGQGDDVTVIFRVSDTGQGMKPEQLDSLFDEYTRFNWEANRTTIGTGLGMSITKRLVELMNGGISVESEVDKGSEFTVRLPQKRINTLICGKEIAERLRNFCFQSMEITKKNLLLREHMPYGSVLVVDDVESNIYVTKGMLLPYRLQVDTAVSGFEAIEKVKSGNVYDIIFMDHMMPKMDGIEAVKIIRSLGYRNYIIALTANAIVGQAEIFLENGFDGYISKPIDSRELNHKLNEFIRNKKPPEVVKTARRKQRESLAKSTANEAKLSEFPASPDVSRNISVSEMRKFFLMDAKSAVGILENILAEQDRIGEEEINSYEITVHGIKSALANIGETGLSAVALKLENAAKEKNLTVMTEEAPAFINELKLLINKLTLMAETGTANAVYQKIDGDDAAFLQEKLLEIKTACEKYNANVARTALKNLMEKEWPGYINDTLDEINVHLLHSAFKKAAAAVEAAIEIVKN